MGIVVNAMEDGRIQLAHDPVKVQKQAGALFCVCLEQHNYDRYVTLVGYQWKTRRRRIALYARDGAESKDAAGR